MRARAWTKGCAASKNLRHINNRNMKVRLEQQLGHVEIFHIDGKKNVADTLTKEMKDSQHHINMANAITSTRRHHDAAAAA